jgi:hypothetical protein
MGDKVENFSAMLEFGCVLIAFHSVKDLRKALSQHLPPRSIITNASPQCER